MYDNTIVYTDYFLHQVIQRLSDSNAIVFYTSDHGEYLGEGAIFIWWPDEYL
jgi:KDO II ethanolaminephosphotransferase